ncbi:MAG: polysaccharide deacetylase family protein [Deltaproteobacteria bacterium]|nr:polysaccharide deacetylase family protein [Deltaproteobacteria bacterium]
MPVKFLNHIIETKGVLHSIERSVQVLRRFSFGKRRFAEMMASLGSGYDAGGLRVTFCITASLLHSHRDFIERSFRGSCHEYAAHGYFHSNMKKKDREEQERILESSYRLFRKCEIDVAGFRCPYLSYNRKTLEALSASPYSWTSNNIIFWDKFFSSGRGSQAHLKKLGLLYRTWNSNEYMSVPRYMGRVLDIPITAPDDEMIYERCRIKGNAEIGKVWNRILRKVHGRGELFHLLFHPERFQFVGGAIRSVVEVARELDQPVWFATLNEITGWWKKRRKTSWAADKTGARRLVLRAPNEATVLVKNRDGALDGFYRGYYPAREAAPGSGLYVFNSIFPDEHTIRISAKASPRLEEFLVNEGFLVKRHEAGGSGTLFIDGSGKFGKEDEMKLLDRIDEAPYPLVRVWRWPRGARSAFTISSDVDSIDIGDYLKRFFNF